MRFCLSVILVVLLGVSVAMFMGGKEKLHAFIENKTNVYIKEQLLSTYPNAAKMLKVDEKTNPKGVMDKVLNTLNRDVVKVRQDNYKLRQENRRLKEQMQQKRRNIKGMFN